MNWFYDLWLQHANKELDNYLYFLRRWSDAMIQVRERGKIRRRLYAAIPPRYSVLVLKRFISYSREAQ